MLSQVPATIGGPSKGVAAEMIAMFSTVEIEHSLYSNSHLCGVVLDIVKCYNAVPRPPLLKALAKLGVNQFIITAFDSMLTHMERFFEISGFCGSSWKTDTGIVEGCSIAVSCMLAVGIWCDRHIAHAEPSANNIMFADNWAIFHHNAEGLKRALQATVQFVDSLKMQLSPCKSWLWATCNKLRQSLKNISVHDIPIPVVLHAKDLGVDQRYAKTVKCPHKKLKVQKTISKMKCIAKAKIPRGYKKQLTNCAGLAIRTYGVAVSLVNQEDYKTLRTATASALLRAGAGTSPWLALNSHDIGLDPQFRDTLQALFAWKRFLQVFPNMKSKIHELFVNGNHKGSPFTRLAANLRDIGWSFSKDDCTWIHNGKCCMSWIFTPKKVVRRILAYSWSEFVAQKCSHRKHFDICSIDTNALDKVYVNADYQNKVFIDQMCVGRNYTNDEMAKWDPHNTGECPLCKQPDSRMHRLFKCAHTKELRKRIPDVISFAARQKDAFWYHGLLPLPTGIFQHLEFLTKYVAPTLTMQGGEQMSHLFVDGTAFFGTKQHWTMAGSSVMEAQVDCYKSKVLDRTMVPGVCQSSFHGELFAVSRALQLRWKVTIFCDCQAVVDSVQELLHHHDRGIPCHRTIDADCWQVIIAQIARRPKGYVLIQKVSAHQDWRKLPMGPQRWCAYHNSCADHHAKESICIDQKVQFDRVTKHEKNDCNLRQIHAKYVAYVCEVAQCFGKTFCKNTKTKCDGGTNFNPLDPLLTETKIGVLKSPTIHEDQYFAFPWGPQVLWRLVRCNGHSNWRGALMGSVNAAEISVQLSFLLTLPSQWVLVCLSACPQDRLG